MSAPYVQSRPCIMTSIVAMLLCFTCICMAQDEKSETSVGKEQVHSTGKTIRLTVNDTIFDLPPEQQQGFGKTLSLAYAIARQALEGAGFEVVGTDANSFNASLSIEINGDRDSLRYSPGGVWDYRLMSYHYTKVYIKGKIKLVIPSLHKSYQRRFSEGMEVRGPIPYGAFPSSDFDLFFYCLKQGGSFYSSVAEMLVKRMIPALYGPRTTQPLLATANHPYWPFRLEALKALAETRDSSFAEVLSSALRDSVTYIREQAAWLLGGIRDSVSIGLLITALQDKDEDVRKQARKSLKKITGLDFGEDIVDWKEWLKKK
jgi:hypothetical protein